MLGSALLPECVDHHDATRHLGATRCSDSQGAEIHANSASCPSTQILDVHENGEPRMLLRMSHYAHMYT